MTIGNTVKDSRQTVSIFDPYAATVVNHLVGQRATRQWNGQDYPSSKPERFIPEERSPGLGALSRPPTRARIEEHPYTCTGTRTTNALCIAHNLGNPALFRTSNGWASPITGASYVPWTASDGSAVLAKIREKVAGSDFNAGVFLGEGKESLRLITSSATKIYNGLRLAKRGRFGEAAQVLTGQGTNKRIARYDDPNWIDSVPFRKRDGAARVYDRDISAGWLELSYGWLPLVKDVQGAAEFLSHQFTVPLQMRIKANRVLKSTGTGTSNSADFEFTRVNRATICQVICILKERDVVSLSGVMDVASVAWELTPWSFVIDWFIPIGNYLAARGVARSLTGDFVVTLFEKATWSGLKAVPSNGSNFASQWRLTSGHEAIRQEFYRVNRTVNTDLWSLISIPSVKPLSSVPSWKRAANSIALLDQLRPRS